LQAYYGTYFSQANDIDSGSSSPAGADDRFIAGRLWLCHRTGASREVMLSSGGGKLPRIACFSTGCRIVMLRQRPLRMRIDRP